MRTTLIAVLAGAALLSSAPLYAAPNIKDGMWEITGKLDMPGMPQNLPPAKHTQCLTGKDAVPHKPEKEQDCKAINVKQQGDGISWSVSCRSAEGTMESSGQANYRGESMDGAMSMNLRDASGKEIMKVSYRISGRRIGECAK